MIDPDFSAYLEGLPEQDKRTVEQALRGLSRFLAPGTEPASAEIIVLRDVVCARQAANAA